MAEWKTALLADMRHEFDATGSEERLASIFFGGGTPSLMPPSLVAFFLSQSAMEGLSAEACVARAKDAFIPTGAPA